jgi:hypothetical protein
MFTYFSLSHVDTMQEATNNFCAIVDKTTKLLISACPKMGKEPCNAGDFAYWQWASSYFTKLPALGLGVDSVAQIDPTILGYPEMSYFKQNFEKQLNGSQNEGVFDGIDFGSPSSDKEYTHLFYIPAKDWFGELPKSSLFHIETLISLFDSIENMPDMFVNPDVLVNFTDYSSFTELLKLEDDRRTYLLMIWMKKMLEVTAMRTQDGGTYLTTNINGVAVGGIQGAHNWLSREFPAYLYGNLMALSNVNTCEKNIKNYIRDVEEEQIPRFCNNTKLDLVSAESYSFYVGFYLSGDYDKKQYIIDQTGASDQAIAGLLTPGYYLERGLMTAMKKVKKVYANTFCTRSVGLYCSNRELAYAQWFNNSISDNPPKPLLPAANLVELTGVHHYKPEIRTYYERIKANPPTFLEYNSTWDLISSGAMYNSKFVGDVILGKNSTAELRHFNTPEFLKYTKMLMIEEAMGGMFIEKTVKDYLEGFEDKILKLTTMSSIEEGGDPTVNPVISLTNPEDGSYNSTGCFFVGDDVHNLVRQQCMYLDSQNIRINGVNVTGIRSWENTKFDPWAEPVPLKGTDAGQFQPLMTNKPDLILFSSDVMMPVEFNYNKGVKRHGMSAWKYLPTRTLLQNLTENENNTKFYSEFHGVLNVTSVAGALAFASKAHYLDIGYNEPSTSMLFDKKGDRIVSDDDRDNLYMIVEPWTGVTMEAALRLMINFMIEPDFLFSNIDKKYLIPYSYIKKEYGMTAHQADLGLGPVRSALNASFGIQIAGYLVGCLLIIAGGLLIFWAWKIKKSEGVAAYSKTEGIQSTEDPDLGKKSPMLSDRSEDF